jgi:hypothetical protein
MKAESSDSESSDEEMHNSEARIPRKKKFVKNVRYNSKGEVVAVEGDSESEDDRKMPAKISKKRSPKVAELMETDSSDEEMDNGPTAEERAFLKSIDKKEKKYSAKAYKSDQESE